MAEKPTTEIDDWLLHNGAVLIEQQVSLTLHGLLTSCKADPEVWTPPGIPILVCCCFVLAVLAFDMLLVQELEEDSIRRDATPEAIKPWDSGRGAIVRGFCL